MIYVSAALNKFKTRIPLFVYVNPNSLTVYLKSLDIT